MNQETRLKDADEFFRVRIPKIERILEVIVIHYKLRNVSNMFLKNVISHVQKSSEFDLSSNEEIFQFITLVAKTAPSFLQLIDNDKGMIVRLNHQIPISDVLKSIRHVIDTSEPLMSVASSFEAGPSNEVLTEHENHPVQISWS